MIRGGLRARLIADSARLMIIAGLSALGWFDGTIYDTPPGPRSHQPLRYVPRAFEWNVPVVPNCLAISADDVYDDPQGLGGDVEDTVELWADVFAESEAVGWHLAGDIRDLALGKFPFLDRTGPVIDVYDFRQATPAPFTQVDIEEVQVDHTEGSVRQYQAHWLMVRMNLVDDYADEFGAVHTVTDWSEDLRPAWDRIQAIEATA